ncbi:hypothetical protein PoB_002804500 [Plakobranchus ocellatus]|uniref:Uncharacterized protein n=1 Tax=Plakobranchus ocellatus TaxID=259542 RepID=A0AAV4A092_9GAST|nr:hypothetical protein PoB_002804500 [Plakobranchus ocellatus]
MLFNVSVQERNSRCFYLTQRVMIVNADITCSLCGEEEDETVSNVLVVYQDVGTGYPWTGIIMITAENLMQGLLRHRVWEAYTTGGCLEDTKVIAPDRKDPNR